MPVVKVLTEGIGEFNLRDIDVYRARGGYEQWRRALDGNAAGEYRADYAG